MIETMGPYRECMCTGWGENERLQRTILGSISSSESSREKEASQRREGTNQEQVIIISKQTCRSSWDKKLHIFNGTNWYT